MTRNKEKIVRTILVVLLLLSFLMPLTNYASDEDWKWAPRASAWSTLRGFLSSVVYYPSKLLSGGKYDGLSPNENLQAIKKARLMAARGPNGEALSEEGVDAYMAATEEASCTLDPNFSIGACVRDIAAYIGTSLTEVFGSLLIASGQFLDVSINLSILNIGNWFTNISGINIAWRIFRDLGNLFFVFILLYIAIGTVFELPQIGNPKKLIVNVIIIALLINFSGFFTRIVIDASNIIAYEFYSKMSGGSGISTGNKWGLGIGGEFVSKLDLTNYLVQDSVTIETHTTDGKPITLKVPTSPKRLSLSSVIVQSFGNIILILVTSFVLMAASVLFLIRSIYLIFLYILSPIAFISILIPGHDYLKIWRGKLIDQSFFAPAFIAPLYMVFLILGDGVTTFAGDNPGPVTIILLDFMLIGMVLGCLFIAKSMGAVGARKAESWGKTIGGMAGGYTIGQAASRIAKSQRMQAWASSTNPITGRIAMGARLALGSVANSGFGTGTKGYESRIEARQKNQQQRAASFVGPQASSQRASYLSRLISNNDRDAYFRSLSPEDRATAIQQLRIQGRGNEANRLLASGSGRAARETSATAWRGIDPGNDAERLTHLNSLDGPQLNNLYEGLNAREKADLESFVARMAPPTPGAAGAPPIRSALQTRIDGARTAFEGNARTTAASRGEATRERGRVDRMRQATIQLNIGVPGRVRLASTDTARIEALRDLAGPEFTEFATNTDLFNGTNADIYPYLTNEQLRSALSMGVRHTERQIIRGAIEGRRGPTPSVDRTLENAYQYLNDTTQGGTAF